MNLSVIGTGYWGPNHVRVFSSLHECVVSSIVDVDASRLERVRRMYPQARSEQDYRRVLDDAAIDAVVIATPTQTHYSLVRDALLANKHVLCEKPLCETTAQGGELVALARERQRVLMVGNVFLFNAGIIKLKELVDTGELGKLQYLAASRMNLGPIRSDVNAAYDLATHDLSIFNWLLNAKPDSVSATGAAFVRPTVEDVVFISLKYPQGVLASIRASWLDPKKVREITVVGNQRMATWDDLQAATPIAIYDKGANTTQDYSDFGEFLRLSMWDGDVRLPKISAEEPLKTQAHEFVQAVQTSIVSRSDGVFSLGIVQTLEAIMKSMRMGGAPVTVNE
jgi:predicted dehydrogenase